MESTEVQEMEFGSGKRLELCAELEQEGRLESLCMPDA